MKPDYKFGDIVINPFASDNNPHKIGFVVRIFNRQGRVNPGWAIELTDMNGDFWTCGKDAELIKVRNILDRCEKLEKVLEAIKNRNFHSHTFDCASQCYNRETNTERACTCGQTYLEDLIKEVEG